MLRQPALDEAITSLESAADVAAAVRRIYGSPLDARGLIHSASVWQGDRGRYVAFTTGRGPSPSQHGEFAAHLARARADAILTSGRALRRQPELDHRLQGPGAAGDALAAWRRDHLLKSEPPVTLVVTANADLDLDHPVFRHWTRPVVLTTGQSQWQLESRAVDQGIEVVGSDTPSVRTAVEFLRRAFGAATIALEVESDALRELSEPPIAVDEVLLTIDQAPRIPAPALGAPFLTAEQLVRRFAERSTPYRVASESGQWCLQRFRR